MQRAVARFIGMKPLERAHIELSNELAPFKDEEDTETEGIHDGLLFYQVGRDSIHHAHHHSLTSRRLLSTTFPRPHVNMMFV